MPNSAAYADVYRLSRSNCQQDATSRSAVAETSPSAQASFLEQAHYAASTINLRVAAVRRLAYEASDAGLLSPDLAAGIRRVKGVRKHGVRTGNWLTIQQGLALLHSFNRNTLRGKRDYAMAAGLLGCGLRRAEVAAVTCDVELLGQENFAFVLSHEGRRVHFISVTSGAVIRGSAPTVIRRSPWGSVSAKSYSLVEPSAIDAPT